MPTPPVELRLFGAAHLRRNGEVLHLGSRKALAVLALLALDGATSRTKLAALLWPDIAADAAARNLRRELFTLRRFEAAPQSLAGRCLALPAALRVDVGDFRAAIESGDLAPALALAAATALDGLDETAGGEFDAWLERSRTALLQQRALARSRLASQLEPTDQATAITLQQQALAEDACDEAAARALMRLHAARGEGAAAAAVLARLTRALRDELDLAPGAETQALARRLAVARDGAAMPPTAPAARAALPCSLLPERLPFVGHAAERAAIAAAWAAGQRVYLSGTAGSGKTRLASVCAADRGAWLRVACEPADSGVAFASALRVLRALREADNDTPLAPWVRRELAWLMPELGDGPPPVAGVEAGERLRAAFAAAWQALAAGNFATVVLDDWQWADDASVGVWARVEVPGVATLVAHRSAQLSAPALATKRSQVDRGTAVVVEVDSLSATDSLALVASAAPSADVAALARRVHEATGGNPFFVVETLRHLSLQGRLGTDPAAQRDGPVDAATRGQPELQLPPSVHAVVLGRVRALGSPARRLLEAASLLGEGFDARLLLGTTDADATAIVAELEHAEAARLLVADATIRGGGYRFAHDLIRQCLASSLSIARRRLLHSRLARRLEATSGAAAAVATQLEGAGDAASAVGWRLRAAQAAWGAHALAETRQHCRHALADGATGPDAVSVYRLLADVERYSGDGAAFLSALQASVDAAHRVDATTWLDARLTQLRHWTVADRGAEVLRALDALAADLDGAPAAQRSRACALRAAALQAAGRLAEARQLEDEAIGLLDGVPQAQAQRAELLDAAVRIAISAHDFARAEALAARAVAAAESAGDDALQARTLVGHGLAVLYSRNDRAGAAAAFERSRTLARRCGHVPQQRAAIMNLVKLHADAGRSNTMLALLDECAALAPGFEHAGRRQKFLEARYFVHYLRGDIAEARAAAQALLESARAINNLHIRLNSAQLVVDLYLHTGDLDSAERLLDDAGDGAGIGMHTVLLAKRAWLELLRGRPAEALGILQRCGAGGRIEDRLIAAWVGAACAMAIDDDADAARRLDDADIAAEHTVDALAMVLVQRLRLARRRGRRDDEARQRALALLPRLPALEAGLLREALG